MRRALVVLAVVAMLGIFAGTAWAGGPYGGPAYGPYGGQGYGLYPVQPYYGYGLIPNRGDEDSFSAQARRIRAYHSRYRVHTHPRSLFKSPPSPYDYWGW
jgi:hypothetical protein